MCIRDRTRLQEGERGAAAVNCDLQQQVPSSRQDPLRNMGPNIINDRDTRENGEGIGRTLENERSNHRVDVVDEIEVGNRKRKCEDSECVLFVASYYELSQF